MAYGSAGLTAGFCILKLLEHGITPDKGEILVTGATGGTGSFALAMLAKMQRKSSPESKQPILPANLF